MRNDKKLDVRRMKDEMESQEKGELKGRIKKENHHCCFERFRMVTKIAVSSSHSSRSGWSFSDGTICVSTSSSNQYAVSSISRSNRRIWQ